MKQANKSHDATAKGFFIVMEFLFILDTPWWAFVTIGIINVISHFYIFYRLFRSAPVVVEKS